MAFGGQVVVKLSWSGRPQDRVGLQSTHARQVGDGSVQLSVVRQKDHDHCVFFSFRERMSQAVWSSKNLMQITLRACQGMWAKGRRDAVARTLEMRIFFSRLIRAETFELYFCIFQCLQSIRP